MQRSLLYAKLHNCTLTGSNLDYMGSIGIDRALLDAAGIAPYEQVQIVNVTNGARLISYTISAPPNSGIVELNGAAARLGMKGDRVIIMAYAQFSSEELQHHQPKVVILGEDNCIEAVRHYPSPLAPVEARTAEAQLV
ncbi:MAG: aspartate 1-decarboxylase [Cyanobacteria bacterium SBC]|nr:aspartate 1-decarboxylase [Cyanobacteria bacterium SBC]